MKKLNFRTAYSARDEENKGIVFPVDSLTQQHFKQECDVNYIVKRYVQTGELEHVSENPPHYGDVADLPKDLFSAYEAVDRAEAAFMDLPSDVRKQLDNDPANLSAWLNNPDNKSAAVRYGLLNQTVLSENTNVEANIDSKVEKKPSESA